jgi:signal transduction histidine kinase
MSQSLPQAVESLRSGLLDAAQKRRLAQRAGESLARGRHTDHASEALVVLAGDPYWEVQKEAADQAFHLPDAAFAKLAEILTDHASLPVRRALARVRKRRHANQKQEQTQREWFHHLVQELETFRKRYGDNAADAVRPIFHELLAKSTGMITHDLGNIVGGLQTNLVLLVSQQKASGCTPVQLQLSSQALDRATFAMCLIDDLRHLASVPAERHPERLQDLIEESVAMVADACKAAQRDLTKVAIRTDVSPELTVPVSRSHFLRAFSNLIKNAIDALAVDGGYNGQIAVAAKESGSYAEVIVEDNGMGMSPEMLHSINLGTFRSSSKKRDGAGLGLIITLKIVDQHGGKIAFAARKSGGTSVTVRLPKVREE